ncbi:MULTISPECIES: SGNH/GDSL hydrolase family protein [Bacillus]|uniref:Hydrolase n=2 Tax=Bacillus TaxID=1386 RepID=A0A0M4FVG5_9BACI|nr:MULTISPECIES: SGNH/GDSL hydrolase family protein [Bacillus]ALC84021.1 hydrolase [Bacillus gobiensis]MBP1082880.1 lysophospholipase L1-like esterase [Bacillus capparidis]MED1098133.1 SGNH/GDSL hydrolase family protein [Bacillus capparidis]
MFSVGDKVLFIGDSITESGKFGDPEGIGNGYVSIINMYVKEHYEDVTILNKGIGGNRVTDLERRWERDVLQENPDWLSISIGINDVWRQIDNPKAEQIYPYMFEEIYGRLLIATKRRLTNTKIILMEPTIIKEDINSKGNKLLLSYVEIVQSLARQHEATLVPAHRIFLKELQKEKPQKLTSDGVHMNEAGNKLLADCWIQAVL